MYRSCDPMIILSGGQQIGNVFKYSMLTQASHVQRGNVLCLPTWRGGGSGQLPDN